MPYGNMGAMMTDAEEAPAAPEPETEAPEEPTAEEDASESEPTAELPKSILGGKEFKPGDEVVLEVVQITGDSVLVKYASGEEETPAEEAPPAEAPAPGGGMGAYME